MSKQTYRNWECIIVNDGSTDDTELIAREWKEKDNRFIYISQKNTGLSGARNRGLHTARGSFLQFLDADDILDPKKLELSLKQLSELDKEEKKYIVLTNFQCFKEGPENATLPFCELKAQYFNFHNILYYWDRKFSIPIHCAFFGRELLEDFSFPLHLGAKEDWIMWLYVFKKKVEVHFIDMPLAFYRSHNDSMTQDPISMEENKIKALLYLENLIPVEELIPFYQYIIKTKYKQVSALQKSINNHRNSRSFRIKQKIGGVIRKFSKR